MSPTYLTSTSTSGKKVAEAIDRLKAKKSSLHLSNKQISDNSKGVLSESAVQRFFSGETADPSMQTFFEIASAMGMTIEEAFGAQPMDCNIPHHHINHDICEKRVAENKAHYEEQLAQCRLRFNERIADLKDSHQRETAHLADSNAKDIGRLTKWLIFLASAFLGLVVFVFVFLMVDVTNHDVGWIRYEVYRELFADDTTNSIAHIVRDIFRRIFNAFI